MSTVIVRANGFQVENMSWWVDRDGHRIIRQRGELLPGCPSHPFGTTLWRLLQILPDPPERPPTPEAA